MGKQRKNYTAQEKFVILKCHLVDHKPVSDICDRYHLQPTVFTAGREVIPSESNRR